MLRIPSPLSQDLEDLIHRVIGCCITVHRSLGPGLIEIPYAKATRIELTRAAISYEAEKLVPVMYRGELLCHQKLDIVVGGQLLLELKAVDHLMPVHRAQVICYLRVSKLPVALLINFNVPILQDGIKRIIL
jgi:GxxExxY protein